jgi:ribosome-associated toxin RatA of RatAB toxin-antitoxin module
MLSYLKNNWPLTRIRRALTEVAFIVFLFYSNLLMGEFTRTNGQGKTLAHAFCDIFTLTNFTIAIIAALLGHGVFHYLRKKL